MTKPIKEKTITSRLSTHEAVCAERYEGITRLLKEMKVEQQYQKKEMVEIIQSIHEDLGELKQSRSFLIGACKALLATSTIIAVILGILEIAKN